jgi:alpha-glucosidase (family GH31 glycosyl hydrolase)
MVRWTEATALMPMMQFSYAPWHYAPATERAVHGFAMLHERLGDYLHEHAVNRTVPLLRPLWYADPDDAALFTEPYAFLLGPDLLAAPVVLAGAAKRDVRLPRGEWLDAWTGEIFSGGQLLVDFPSPCPGLPLFVRTCNDTLFKVIHQVLADIVRGSVPSGMTTSTYMAGLNRDLTVTG